MQKADVEHRGNMPDREVELRQASIVKNILQERIMQDVKWGVQNHEPQKWLAILMEELGEASKAWLENKKGKYQAEMIQVAAVALAALECFERNLPRYIEETLSKLEEKK